MQLFHAAHTSLKSQQSPEASSEIARLIYFYLNFTSSQSLPFKIPQQRKNIYLSAELPRNWINYSNLKVFFFPSEKEFLTAITILIFQETIIPHPIFRWKESSSYLHLNLFWKWKADNALIIRTQLLKLSEQVHNINFSVLVFLSQKWFLLREEAVLQGVSSVKINSGAVLTLTTVTSMPDKCKIGAAFFSNRVLALL